jgi:hypothetical protein
MSFLPKLLAIVAILLPLESGERSEPAQLALATTPFSVWVHELLPPSPQLTAAQLPLPTESFFERLDEMAYDEEDSTRVEDHGPVALTLLDHGAPMARRSFAFFAPTSSPTLSVLILPVLRC